MVEIKIYKNDRGQLPFDEWIRSLKDKRAVARIQVRLKKKKGVRSLLLHSHFCSSNKKRGQVFTFASSLTLFDKVKDTHFIMHSVS